MSKTKKKQRARVGRPFNDPGVRGLRGRMIRARRAMLGLSLDDLVDTVGVSRATLSRWENDEVRPTAESLARLAKALSCKISDLTKNGIK